MPSEADLLRAILDAPDHDAPRLAYADWCDQRGTPPPDPRGEFIRLQIELEQRRVRGFDAPDRDGEIRQRMLNMQNSQREAEIHAQFASVWARDVAAVADGFTFRRGFIGHVSLSAQRFIDHADRLMRLAPIVHWDVTNARPVFERFMSTPQLASVRALSLSENGLTDDDMRFLCDSPYVARLWWLDLSFNQIGPAGVERLAAARNLRHIYFLSLASNPSDPRETIGVEGESIVDGALPQEGKDLEARFGTIPWLHCHAATTRDFPPDPLGPPRRP